MYFQFSGYYLGGKKIRLQTVITFALLQMPAVSLAFYGVFCAFRFPSRILERITNSFRALTIIILPYCVTELYYRMHSHSELTRNGLDFVITDAVKPIWSPLIDMMSVTFDLFWYLPNKDHTGMDRFSIDYFVQTLECSVHFPHS